MSSLLIINNQFALICRYAFYRALEMKDGAVIKNTASYIISHLNNIPEEEIRAFIDGFDDITAGITKENVGDAVDSVLLLKKIMMRDINSRNKIDEDCKKMFETEESDVYIPEWEVDVFSVYALRALKYVNNHPDEEYEMIYRFWIENMKNINRNIVEKAYQILLESERDAESKKKHVFVVRLRAFLKPAQAEKDLTQKEQPEKSKPVNTPENSKLTQC